MGLAGKLLDRLIDALPQPDLFPKTRTVYESMVTMRRTEDVARRPVRAVTSDASDLAEAISPKALVRLASGLVMSLEDQWSIIGYKGTGKTTLSTKLLAAYRNAWPIVGVNILDTKPEKALAQIGTRFETDSPPPPAPPGEVYVWAPLDNNPQAFDDWFGAILHQHEREPDDTPSLTYVDELSSIGGNSPQSFPTNFNRMMKQGRSNKKTLLLLSQEAAWIPRNVLGQATHLVRLRLVLESDALRCDAILHGRGSTSKDRKEPASRYGFWHRRLDSPGPASHFTDWRAFLT